jgi:hypothetical protein
MRRPRLGCGGRTDFSGIDLIIDVRPKRTSNNGVAVRETRRPLVLLACVGQVVGMFVVARVPLPAILPRIAKPASASRQEQECGRRSKRIALTAESELPPVHVEVAEMIEWDTGCCDDLTNAIARCDDL